MVRKYLKLFVTLSIIATMLVGCGNAEQTGVSNEIGAIESDMSGGTDITDTTDTNIDTPVSSDTVNPTDEPTPTETPEPAHEHSYTSSVTKEATCTELGETTYSCECGDTYKEDIEQKNHTESDWIVVTEVTATTDGLQHKICTICNEELTSEVVSHETFVVASGKLEDAPIEWKIVGTTLYVSGTGAIPDFEYRTGQAKLFFPEKTIWNKLVGWQTYTDNVEKIVIEEGITKIGKNNFSDFEKVKEIVFADSVTEVGQWAFFKSGVETIDFNNITKFGDQPFGALLNIKHLSIPGTIKTISYGCFYDCESPYLTDIYVEEGVEIIEDHAFDKLPEGCSLHLPSSITKLDILALTKNMTVYVKAGSYAETYLKEKAQYMNLTVITE